MTPRRSSQISKPLRGGMTTGKRYNIQSLKLNRARPQVLSEDSLIRSKNVHVESQASSTRYCKRKTTLIRTGELAGLPAGPGPRRTQMKLCTCVGLLASMKPTKRGGAPPKQIQTHVARLKRTSDKNSPPGSARHALPVPPAVQSRRPLTR